MSTIRANTVTDAAGTGSPSFPNGLSVASPALTGVPTAPTAAVATNTTQIATTAFVLANGTPLASPAFTGTPTAPTAAAATNTTQIATTAFVLANTISVSQTWQTMTGSRALNTNYTNSTDRPIMVNIMIIQGSGGQGRFRVGGIDVSGQNLANAGLPSMISAVVPPNGVYQMATTAGSQSISFWAELR